MPIDSSTIRRLILQNDGTPRDCGVCLATFQQASYGLSDADQTRVLRLLLVYPHVTGSRPGIREDLISAVEEYADLLRIGSHERVES